VTPADTAIRALAKGVAQAAIELVWENVQEGAELAHVYRVRHELADAVAEATMECADDDRESEVHAIRRLVSAS
jgi:hypothetical protein